mmetsp:Transcript_115227/g.298756  ORF Transcript_115227/g.298756 Transcript_115227/m.298756 type:complete len:372 (+) Transcript_115227:683-1798(+)
MEVVPKERGRELHQSAAAQRPDLALGGHHHRLAARRLGLGAPREHREKEGLGLGGRVGREGDAGRLTGVEHAQIAEGQAAHKDEAELAATLENLWQAQQGFQRPGANTWQLLSMVQDHSHSARRRTAAAAWRERHAREVSERWPHYCLQSIQCPKLPARRHTLLQFLWRRNLRCCARRNDEAPQLLCKAGLQFAEGDEASAIQPKVPDPHPFQEAGHNRRLAGTGWTPDLRARGSWSSGDTITQEGPQTEDLSCSSRAPLPQQRQKTATACLGDTVPVQLCTELNLLGCVRLCRRCTLLLPFEVGLLRIGKLWPGRTIAARPLRIRLLRVREILVQVPQSPARRRPGRGPLRRARSRKVRNLLLLDRQHRT